MSIAAASLYVAAKYEQPDDAIAAADLIKALSSTHDITVAQLHAAEVIVLRRAHFQLTRATSAHVSTTRYHFTQHI